MMDFHRGTTANMDHPFMPESFIDQTHAVDELVHGSVHESNASRAVPNFWEGDDARPRMSSPSDNISSHNQPTLPKRPCTVPKSGDEVSRESFSSPILLASWNSSEATDTAESDTDHLPAIAKTASVSAKENESQCAAPNLVHRGLRCVGAD